MDNSLESIEICPGENGDHRVVHNFKREAGKKEGSMGSGLNMERPKPAVAMPALLAVKMSGKPPVPRIGLYRVPFGRGYRVPL